MAKFKTPYYLDNYEKQFRFEEYEDTQNYFLRLIYLINRNSYAHYAVPHGTYPALNTDVVAGNGRKIFRDAGDLFNSGRAYKLLSESARDRAPIDMPGVIQIEQIYGYAPQVTHVRSEEVDWVQPGWIDRSTAAEFATRTDGTQTVIFDEIANEFSVRLDAVPVGLSPGDLVQVRAGNPGRSGGTWVYSTDIWTEQTPVLRIVGTTVYIAASTVSGRTYNPTTYETADVTLSPYLAGGTIGNVPQGSVTVTFNHYRRTPGSTIGNWRRIGQEDTPGNYCILLKVASGRPSRGRSIGATVGRTYFDASSGLPVQLDALAPQYASGEATDTLDINTQPTVAEYQTMIANGDLIRPRGQRVGQVLGDVWYLDDWQIAAQ